MSDIQKLESTQRAFTRYISGCRGLGYWDRLKVLNLSLQRLRERYIIIHVFKTQKGIAPNDLSMKFYDHICLGTRCCVPPLPPLMSDIQKLESTQRAFTRYISGCRGLGYWDRLKVLNLSLQRLRERYIIIHVFKTQKGIAPNDLSMKFYDHICLGTRCCVPPLPKESSIICKVDLRHIFCSDWPEAMEHPPPQRHLCSVPKVF